MGSGLVGKSWAMIFASQGYQVRLDILNVRFASVISMKLIYLIVT